MENTQDNQGLTEPIKQEETEDTSIYFDDPAQDNLDAIPIQQIMSYPLAPISDEKQREAEEIFNSYVLQSDLDSIQTKVALFDELSSSFTCDLGKVLLLNIKKLVDHQQKRKVREGFNQ